MTSKESGRPIFSEVFQAHSDYVSDKWEHYLSIYEAEIGPMVQSGRPLNLLEIGVQNGGSLQIWSKYLPPGSMIVGVDVNDKCLSLQFPQNVSFINASACDSSIKELLPNVQFDVIIDDGSHVQADIMASFSILFDRVAPGGKYIIEDAATSYDPSYGGGFRSGRGSIDWAKGFVDALNVDHISPADQSAASDAENLKQIGRLLWRVAFYDSVIVFHTLKTPKERPFSRVFTGETAHVMDPLEWTGHVNAEAFATIGLSEGMHRHIDAALVAQVQALLARDAEIGQALSLLRDHIAGLHETDAVLRDLLMKRSDVLEAACCGTTRAVEPRPLAGVSVVSEPGA